MSKWPATVAAGKERLADKKGTASKARTTSEQRRRGEKSRRQERRRKARRGGKSAQRVQGAVVASTTSYIHKRTRRQANHATCRGQRRAPSCAGLRPHLGHPSLLHPRRGRRDAMRRSPCPGLCDAPYEQKQKQERSTDWSDVSRACVRVPRFWGARIRRVASCPVRHRDASRRGSTQSPQRPRRPGRLPSQRGQQPGAARVDARSSSQARERNDLRVAAIANAAHAVERRAVADGVGGAPAGAWLPGRAIHDRAGGPLAQAPQRQSTALSSLSGKAMHPGRSRYIDIFKTLLCHFPSRNLVEALRA